MHYGLRQIAPPHHTPTLTNSILLLAFGLIYFLVVKAKIKKLFAAMTAVARAIKTKLPHKANPDLIFIALAEFIMSSDNPTTTLKKEKRNVPGIII